MVKINSIFRGILLVPALFCAVGCTALFGERVPLKPRRVSAVSVVVDPQLNDPEILNSLRKNKISELLTQQLGDLLRLENGYDPSSPLKLQVNITGWRLRDEATVALQGVWSGKDRLVTQVDLYSGAEKLTEFNAQESLFGNVFNIRERSRSESLVESVAREVTYTLNSIELDERQARTVPQLPALASAPPAPKLAQLARFSAKERRACSVDEVVRLQRSGMKEKTIRERCL